MHNVSIAIILNTIIEQYTSEKHFYETHLGITEEQWEAWKKRHNGVYRLLKNQKVKTAVFRIMNGC